MEPVILRRCLLLEGGGDSQSDMSFQPGFATSFCTFCKISTFSFVTLVVLPLRSGKSQPRRPYRFVARLKLHGVTRPLSRIRPPFSRIFSFSKPSKIRVICTCLFALAIPRICQNCRCCAKPKESGILCIGKSNSHALRCSVGSTSPRARSGVAGMRRML